MWLPFASRGNPHALAVGMTGVRMGESFAQIGCGDPGRLGAIAAKVGLSGRAAAYALDDAGAARAQKGGVEAGVLIDVAVAPGGSLPAPDSAFDVVVVDETDRAVAAIGDNLRAGILAEARRIARPGGRVMIVATGTPSGLGAMLKRAPAAAPSDRIAALGAAGLRSARPLADREGLLFIEAVKPRTDG